MQQILKYKKQTIFDWSSFCFPVYKDVGDVLFTKMSSIYADFFWLDVYE